MRQDRPNPPTMFGAGLLGGPSGAATDPGLTRPRCVCVLLRRTRDIALTRPSLSAHTLFTALCLAAATAPLGRHHNTRTRFMLDHLTYHYHYGRGRKPWPGTPPQPPAMLTPRSTIIPVCPTRPSPAHHAYADTHQRHHPHHHHPHHPIIILIAYQGAGKWSSQRCAAGINPTVHPASQAAGEGIPPENGRHRGARRELTRPFTLRLKPPATIQQRAGKSGVAACTRKGVRPSQVTG